MECPQCGLDNPPNVTACAKCQTSLPIGDSEDTILFSQAVSIKAADQTATGPGGRGGLGFAVGVKRSVGPVEIFVAGQLVADRYQILELLGEGGMGAVYKVRDQHLDRLVALKVIRPALAQNAQALSRFKQELILARQVTHRNVVRIYDLAEADGVKFITMEFVDGRSLASLLREKGRLAPKEAAEIVAQVCRALEAAHAEGVVHRDLKPQNIMVNTIGKVVVMDFGIARSTETANMTQSGALVGTPEYMSPEQAKGERVDARSDLFSIGIILYELLTGKSPFKADTTMATLYKRTTERARPPIELSPEIPEALNQIAVRCLEIDREKRYGSATEALEHLEEWLGPEGGKKTIPAGRQPLREKIAWVALGGVVVLAAGAVAFREKFLARAPAVHREVSVLVADFENRTAEPVFDETLEPAFIIGLEGASFIQSFSRSTAQSLAAQLRPGIKSLDEATARLVATREGIDVIVLGSIGKDGNEYALHVRALDGITGKNIVEKSARTAKTDALSHVGRLSADIRSALGDTTPEAVKLSAQETFTTETLEAAHEYAEGQTLLWDGKWEESIPHYQQAVELDPNMGRAYAGMAVASGNLGRQADKERYFEQALAHIDRMTDREKYRTRGAYYVMKGEPRKALEEYAALLRLFPYDDAGHTNLAICHFYLREMKTAVEEARLDVKNNPRGLMQRTNLALYEVYNGSFAGAVSDAEEVLKHDPKSVTALGAKAMGFLGQGKLAEAVTAYEHMGGTGRRGASSSATGLADIALYEGRMSDAVEILERGIGSDLTSKSADAEAIKQNYLAFAQLVMGDNRRALATAEKALTSSREPQILYGAARVEIEAGQTSKAGTLASELGHDLSPDAQSYGQLILGESELKNGAANRAVSKFQEAEKMADSWLVHFDLGRSYLAYGAFAEALSEFDVCMSRRSEATFIFLDDVPSYHYYPPLLYYRGLALEGLKSPGGTEAFRQFLAIKAKGADDPMIADARKRLGSAIVKR